MAKIFKQWTVLPHGKLSRIDDNVLSVVGEIHMPIGDFPRRMTVVRLQSGQLIIYSAIALDEPEMEALEAFGEPAYMIVPNERHRMDAKIWKDRYPKMRVIAPNGSREKVEEVVPVDQTSVDFGDPGVHFITVPGTDEKELALLVETTEGTTLILNELIWNIDDRPGFGGWLFHTLGMTGDEPKIPTIIAHKDVKDKEALKMQLKAWAGIRDLRRIVVSHGDIVTRTPAAVLDHLATALE